MVLLCVMVCLVIATTLVGNGVRSAVTVRQQIRVERDLRQLERVVEAGLQRAYSRILHDVDYTGETWLLGERALPGLDPAQVEIKVTPLADREARQVRVTVTLPADAERPYRRSETIDHIPSDQLNRNED